MPAYPRSTEPTVHARREPADGACSECGQAALQRYRVLSEGGWFDVVKCGACLASVAREPGPLFGVYEPIGAPR